MTPQRPDPGEEAPGEAPRPGLAPLQVRALRTSIAKDIFQIVAFSAAGIWAIWLFWYQSSYVPKHQEPRLTLSLRVEKIGERGDQVVLRGRLTLHNPGKVGLQVGAFAFDAAGTRLEPVPGPGEAPAPPAPNAASWQAMKASRASASRLVASSGRLILPPQSITVDPDEEVTEDDVFAVDRREVDLVTLRAYAVVMRHPGTLRKEWFAVAPEASGGWLYKASEACPKGSACGSDVLFATTSASLWDGTGAALTAR